MPRRLRLVAATLGAVTMMSAHADSMPCDPAILQRQAQAAQQAQQAMFQRINGLQASMQQGTGSKIQAGACLGNIMNISLPNQVGLPSMTGVIDGLLQAAMSAACKMVQQEIGKVTGPLNQSMQLPNLSQVIGSQGSGPAFQMLNQAMSNSAQQQISLTGGNGTASGGSISSAITNAFPSAPNAAPSGSPSLLDRLFGGPSTAAPAQTAPVALPPVPVNGVAAAPATLPLPSDAAAPQASNPGLLDNARNLLKSVF